MNRLRYLALLSIVLAIAAIGLVASDDAHSQAAADIVLTPDTGFSSFTVSGTGFGVESTVTITWDGIPMTTFPDTQVGGSSFTTIVDVPDSAVPGVYTVFATDGSGNSDSEVFTVIDTTGPEGPQGPQGPQGDEGISGSQGPAGDNGAAGRYGSPGADGAGSGGASRQSDGVDVRAAGTEGVAGAAPAGAMADTDPGRYRLGHPADDGGV